MQNVRGGGIKNLRSRGRTHREVRVWEGGIKKRGIEANPWMISNRWITIDKYKNLLPGAFIGFQ